MSKSLNNIITKATCLSVLMIMISVFNSGLFDFTIEYNKLLKSI